MTFLGLVSWEGEGNCATLQHCNMTQIAAMQKNIHGVNTDVFYPVTPNTGIVNTISNLSFLWEQGRRMAMMHW